MKHYATVTLFVEVESESAEEARSIVGEYIKPDDPWGGGMFSGLRVKSVDINEID